MYVGGEDSNDVDSPAASIIQHKTSSSLPEIREDMKSQDEHQDGCITHVDFDTLVKFLPRPNFMGEYDEITSPELKWIKFCSTRWLLTSDIMVGGALSAYFLE